MKTILAIVGVSLSLAGAVLAGEAVAQTAKAPPDESQAAQASPASSGDKAEAGSKGAEFFFDRRGTGSRIRIKCADNEATRACVEAAQTLIGAVSSGQGGGVAYATTSIKCGGTVYEVSTGTNGGNCSVSGPQGGPRNSAGCNDGANVASASCDTGCGATGGSGSCTIKQ